MRCAKCGKSSGKSSINNKKCWQKGLCRNCFQSLDKHNIEQRIKSSELWIQKYEARIIEHKKKIAKYHNMIEQMRLKEKLLAETRPEKRRMMAAQISNVSRRGKNFGI